MIGQAHSFGQLATALGASIMLAYLLMAVLYNSLIHPLVILFAVPAAVGGAIAGLLIFGYSPAGRDAGAFTRTLAATSSSICASG
jgi:multidrug efflux pump subunit AcrB